MTRVVVLALSLAVLAGCATTGPKVRPLPPEAWRGVHVYMANRADLAALHRAIEEAFAPKGVNTLIFEMAYHFEFESHPELRDSGAMTKEDARELAALCKRHGIRLIPQLNCLGHQGGSSPMAFLREYPELHAPRVPPVDDPAFYHRSWNPLDPKSNEIALALIDDLVDAFEPDAFHVGMDEVMLFPDETTAYYHGETNAEMFAKAVNDLHGHVVGTHGLTMLMWGDRLLEHGVMPYHSYESSANGTAPAIDLIPKDIVICDWHYLRRPDYPSVPYFQEKGFRVWPTSWKSTTAAQALMAYAQQDATDRMLGHLCTTWCNLGDFSKAAVDGEAVTTNGMALRAAETFDAVAQVWKK